MTSEEFNKLTPQERQAVWDVRRGAPPAHSQQVVHIRERVVYAKVKAQRGGAGNVVAAVVSFFIPGLGQLCQGRIVAAVFVFFIAFFCWLTIIAGPVGHILAALDAAMYKQRF